MLKKSSSADGIILCLVEEWAIITYLDLRSLHLCLAAESEWRWTNLIASPMKAQYSHQFRTGTFVAGS
jgi:hypothetical protein